MSTVASNGALHGLRVLDLSRVLAGPWCTQILGDFGADVLKVEKPGRGDDTRAWGPPYLTDADGIEDEELSAYYLSCNRNKRSVAIDIAHPGGAALIRRLAAKADVLVENFKVGGLAKYGLDYPALSAINPRLVYCSITGFGQTGPYAARGGYDFVAQGMGGMMSVTGESDGPPLRTGVATADLSTGMYAAVSILVALRHAEATGAGQQIDLALLDTQVAMMANQALSYLVSGVVPGRMGNRHPTVVPYTTFEVADGTIVIAVGNDGQFRLLCGELGMPELGNDPRFATARARVANRDAIEALVRDKVRALPGAALVARLTAGGIPAGPVNDLKHVFDDPAVVARGTLQRFASTTGEHIPSVAYPAKLSLTPASYRYPPPRVGADSVTALLDWLELEGSVVEALIADGVLAARRSA
jgi:crotonobetainyl-CoA:carnitine CoA-transferase CaiB-like acyl-CoA transferase